MTTPLSIAHTEASSGCGGQLIRDNDVAPDRIDSVPTGIDAFRFAPSDRTAMRREIGPSSDGPIVGVIATLRRWKGHRYLLVPARNPRALSDAIDAPLDHPDAAARLATAARAFVLPRYGVETMLDRMETVFRRALVERRNRTPQNER